MFRIYLYSEKIGWKKVAYTNKLQEAINAAKDNKELGDIKYLIIEETVNGDQVIKNEDFSKECTIEFVDNLKTNIEIQATTFTPEQRKRPSKMKQKEELRKLTEDYIER